MRSREGFGEGINKIVTSRDMSNTQLRQLNQVTNKVIINRKVFHVIMKNRISREIMAPRLSENREDVDCTGTRSSDNNDFTNCSSVVVVAVMAQYLASVEDRVTVHCFVELQVIGLTPRNMRKAPIEVTSIWVTSSVRIKEIVQCMQEPGYQGISCH